METKNTKFKNKKKDVSNKNVVYFLLWNKTRIL